jgi:hypothetical protein
MSIACESVKFENAASDQKSNANIQKAGNTPAQNAGNQSGLNGVENSSPRADMAERNFEGTAGITEKKYEIKQTAILEDVRVGRHEGFDRVVFEFEDAELPSYRVAYIDKPVRACGSGDVVPLAGDGWLEIRFTSAAAHNENGEATVKNRAQSPNLKIIKEMKSTCDFEAEVEWVLGVAAPNKYRVLELKNPTRLAIDIKH